MFNLASFLLYGTVFASALVSSSAANNNQFNMKPFKIDLSDKFPRLKSLVANSHLPTKALYSGTGPEKGMEVETLRALKTFNHFTADIEGQSVHFIHEKSADPNAIPIILLHGWPGSFHEFTPVIKNLTQPVKGPDGKTVSYHVVVPSLPGFVFSSPPPLNWTNSDTARIFNTLMTQVLSYPNYAVHGTDLGASLGYNMYSSFNTTVRAAHLVFLPFVPPTREEIAAKNITLSDAEMVALQRIENFLATGIAYNMEQATKPNDIGLALFDNPVGQLTWMGSKFKAWSDPRAGTPPSQLTDTAILTSISLYYLTGSFWSSVWIYAQNPGIGVEYTKAPTDAPLLYSQYEWTVGFFPREYTAKVGNLVYYTVHNFGGHFAGLDNPPALIDDIRHVARYFET
ncbi:epoxide hydrolase domain protein, partial [Favolaschia claudopus]